MNDSITIRPNFLTSWPDCELRPSSLTSWPDCERRGAAWMLRREVEAAGFKLNESRQSIAASVGTGTHAGAATILKEKIKTGEPGNLTEAEQAALESLYQTIREGVIFDDTTTNPNTAERQVLRMVKTFHVNLAPIIQPIAVEERLKAAIEPGFILSGQKDVSTIEPGAVRDLKTGVINRTHAAQLGAYALLELTHGTAIVEGRIDFIKRVRVNKEQPPPVSVKYPLKEIQFVAMHRIKRIISEVKEFRRRLESGTAPPEWAFDVNPNSMLCRKKNCPAWGSSFCNEWQFKEDSK